MGSNEGYVYILTSPKTEYIKIGGTDYPPVKRLREINSTEPYHSLGPWTLIDFRQVRDWRKVEYFLHYTFRSRVNKKIAQQKELFNISSQEVSKILDTLSPELIINKPKIDRLFQDDIFLSYIVNLFKFTGLLNWLNIQGAWTFALFPKTSGGRYFTINIGPHEVAYSSLGRKDYPQYNMILVDRLIFDFAEVINWIKKHNGIMVVDEYATALSRSASLRFEGTFEDVNEFLALEGVRRALIAYWSEALIRMNENKKMSIYAKYHNWNAVARIMKRIGESNNN